MVHLLAELGVILLLFAIGLETDLRKLLKVGGTSAAVAAVGVVLPFALGYAACRLLGLANLVAIVAGAALTATSVGITARVLSDLGRLQEPESQIILGAAVIDDIIGLVILTVVAGLTQGEQVTALGRRPDHGGRLRVPARDARSSAASSSPTREAREPDRPAGDDDDPGGDAGLRPGLARRPGRARRSSSGPSPRGSCSRRTPRPTRSSTGSRSWATSSSRCSSSRSGRRSMSGSSIPLDPSNRPTLLVGGLLIVAAVVGKFAAGYAAPWFKGRKSVIGVGMIPRGEVGLIFAQMGLASGVFDAKLFSAVTLMVMVTTFLAPPLLRVLFPPGDPAQNPAAREGIADL